MFAIHTRIVNFSTTLFNFVCVCVCRARGGRNYTHWCKCWRWRHWYTRRNYWVRSCPERRGACADPAPSLWAPSHPWWSRPPAPATVTPANGHPHFGLFLHFRSTLHFAFGSFLPFEETQSSRMMSTPTHSPSWPSWQHSRKEKVENSKAGNNFFGGKAIAFWI